MVAGHNNNNIRHHPTQKAALAPISAAFSLSRATDIGSFYISESASRVLVKLKSREQLNYNKEPMFDIYESEYQAHQLALDEFLDIVKKDLKIK